MLKLFDFLCTDCGHNFEKMAKDFVVECPKCGSTKVIFQHSPQAIKASGLGVHDTKMRTK